MDGFSWLVDGELAAMPLPGRHRDLADDAEFLRLEGVRTLVSLTETPPDAGVLEAYDINQLHIPVRDFTAPTLEQMIEFVDVVSASAARGEPAGVHCTWKVRLAPTGCSWIMGMSLFISSPKNGGHFTGSKTCGATRRDSTWTFPPPANENSRRVVRPSIGQPI